MGSFGSSCNSSPPSHLLPRFKTLDRSHPTNRSYSSLVERSVPRESTERVDHLAAALRYASQGVPVFPLAPRSKFLLISAANDGHGLHDATTDAARIQAWWMAHPTANIGLRTSISFDVIDLDTEAAVDALEQARAGREPLRGPVVQTGHGFHGYVKPTGVGNRAGVRAGVDFRGRGAMYSGHLLSIQRVTDTAGSTPYEKGSHPRRIGSFSSLSQNVVRSGPELCLRGLEPTDLEHSVESFSGSPRQGKVLATTSSIPLRSIWAGW